MNNNNKKPKLQNRPNFSKVEEGNELNAALTDQERLDVKPYLKTSIGVLNLLAVIFLIPCLIAMFFIVIPFPGQTFTSQAINIEISITIPVALFIEIACLITNFTCLAYKTSRCFDITLCFKDVILATAIFVYAFSAFFQVYENDQKSLNGYNKGAYIVAAIFGLLIGLVDNLHFYFVVKEACCIQYLQ